MKITLIGWYGTETIGDRAILAGLFSFFVKAFDTFEILLGSLYPFFSERTLYEDGRFWKELTGREINITLFNSKNSGELDQAIKDSDFVVMGGGPLMHLGELYMVEYAFRKAKKSGKKTALLGCGIGPLFQKEFRKSVLTITQFCDLIILRDSASKDSLHEIYREFGKTFDSTVILTSFDPAVECCLQYNDLSHEMRNNYIAVNLRSFPENYSKTKSDINKDLVKFIERLSHSNSDREVKLIPMHYFHIGDDDREFLNQIALTLNQTNISVQNKPLNLKETLSVYKNAYFNVGMRFHSVVFQTLVSGRNYILDYTEPKKGKIYGFIADIDSIGFYAGRTICLQTDIINPEIVKNTPEQFQCDPAALGKKLGIYIDELKRLSRL